MSWAVMIGASPRDGSSRSKHLGSRHQRPGNGQCLAFASRQRRRRVWWRPANSAGKSSNTSASCRSLLAPSPQRPQPEVLLHGELLDDAATFGNMGHAVAHDVLDAAPDELLSPKRTDPARGRTSRRHGSEQGRLAGAVGAEDGGDGAFLGDEAHVFERGDVAVVDRQSRDGDPGHSRPHDRVGAVRRAERSACTCSPR